MSSESTHFLSDFYFDFFLKLKFLHYSSFVSIAQLTSLTKIALLLKYGSDEKGSSLYKSWVFLCQKN